MTLETTETEMRMQPSILTVFVCMEFMEVSQIKRASKRRSYKEREQKSNTHSKRISSTVVGVGEIKTELKIYQIRTKKLHIISQNVISPAPV